MNEVTLTLDKKVLKELIKETIKERMDIKAWCNGEIITINLMLDNEIMATDSICLNGGTVGFY